MNKEQLLEKTMEKLQDLSIKELKETNDFVDFLREKASNRKLTQSIQKQAEEGETFSFLEDEEELYSTDDLIEHTK